MEMDQRNVHCVMPRGRPFLEEQASGSDKQIAKLRLRVPSAENVSAEKVAYRLCTKVPQQRIQENYAQHKACDEPYTLRCKSGLASTGQRHCLLCAMPSRQWRERASAQLPSAGAHEAGSGRCAPSCGRTAGSAGVPRA
jgi:hypothetical protein